METNQLTSDVIMRLECQAESLLREYLFSPENEEAIAGLMSGLLAELMSARGASRDEIHARIAAVLDLGEEGGVEIDVP
ncbi:MAG: hypothetical protein ACYC55_06200 [Candidatus Geothermincolia bacterium]